MGRKKKDTITKGTVMIVREKEDASFAWGKESSNIRIPKDRTVISIIRTLPEQIWICWAMCPLQILSLR